MLRWMRVRLQRSTKLTPKALVESLQKRGTSAFFGCPDYHLRSLTSYLADHAQPGAYVLAAHPGNAMAMAAGHHLATLRPPCVFLQNSGLGDATNPLLTLFSQETYQMPCLMLVSWRGKPDTADGALQPGLATLGRMTEHCLTAMDVPYSILSESESVDMNWDVIVDKAYYHMSTTRSPFAVLIEPQTLADYAQHRPDSDPLPPAPLDHDTVVDQICRQFNSSDAFVCGGGAVQASLCRARGTSTGQDFLLAAVHGQANSVAAGVALAKPGRQVVCLEGDGAALAHMGAMATVGALNAAKDASTGLGLLRNLKHIVVNDGVYSGEGGQASAAFDVSLTGVAKACGYFAVREEPVLELGDLVAALAELRQCDGPAFLEVVVSKKPSSVLPVMEAERDLEREKQSFAEFLLASDA